MRHVVQAKSDPEVANAKIAKLPACSVPKWAFPREKERDSMSPDPNYGQPQSKSVVQPILIGAVVALFGGLIYQFVQADKLNTKLLEVEKSYKEDVEALKIASSQSAQASRRNQETLQGQLETAQRQAAMAVGQAKEQAVARAESLTKAIGLEVSKQKQIVAEEFDKVKKETERVSTEATARIGEVKTDVGAVKEEVKSTKSELDKTINSLKATQGDLGVQSGLIATNGTELQALKALGERNYFEFNLGKTKAPQRIGDILMQLKKTDNKRNKYTVEITADDKKVEKRDKGVSEPVQFYTSKARQPYEIVVMEVKKDQIVGYLATPKVMAPRK